MKKIMILLFVLGILLFSGVVVAGIVGTSLSFLGLEDESYRIGGLDDDGMQIVGRTASPPSDLEVVDMTSTSISLIWTKGEYSERTLIRYSTSSYPSSVTSGTSGYFGIDDVVTISSLSSGQIYYFRAWSYTTAEGYSDTYDSVSDYTLPASPTFVSLTPISSTRIDLLWTNGSGGDSSAIRVSTAEYPETPTDGSSVYYGTDTGWSADDLTEGTEYFFSIFAYDTNSEYYSEIYDTESAVTLTDPDVYSQAASRISMTTARLNAYLGSGENIYVRFQYGTPQQLFAYTEDSSTNVYGTHWATQTFTTGSSGYTVDSIGLKIYRVDSCGVLTVSIRATAGGQPTGADLTSGTLAQTNMTTSTDGEWEHVDLTDYSLSASTTYALVVKATSGDASNKVVWLLDSSSPSYSGGSLGTSTDSGSTWSMDTNKDCMFAVWSAQSSTDWEYSYDAGEDIYEEIDGLDDSSVYRFRAQACLSEGVNIQSGDWLMFVTWNDISEPSDLSVSYVSSGTVSVSWIIGDGSYMTKVMYKEALYPSSHSDGNIAYFGSGSSTTLSGLTSGVTYYFRAWSYSPASNWSTNYDSDMITIPFSESDSTNPVEDIDTPDNWLTESDPSNLEDAFFYTPIVNAADSLGMESGSLFLVFGISVSIALGLFAFIISRSMMFSLGAVLFGMIGCSLSGILPLWIVFAYIVTGGTYVYITARV